MIRSSFIVAIILFVSYCLFIHFNLNIAASQNQWQENVIKAQKYIYSTNRAPQNVIVGTSLSNRLLMDSLPGFINLSFAGESIYDGLNVISLKDSLPVNLYIEMNLVLKEQKEDLNASLTNPIFFKLRKHIFALREDRQPLAISGNAINTFFLKYFISDVKSWLGNDKVSLISEVNSFKQLLAVQRSKYMVEPEQAQMDKCFKKLEILIASLRQRNVNVIFYEMPINKQLINLPTTKRIREEFLRRFPDRNYSYILTPPNIDDYVTTDGVHLKKNEAIIYTFYFKEELKKYVR